MLVFKQLFTVLSVLFHYYTVCAIYKEEPLYTKYVNPLLQLHNIVSGRCERSQKLWPNRGVDGIKIYTGVFIFGGGGGDIRETLKFVWAEFLTHSRNKKIHEWTGNTN
jgi:hypothetical protein